MNAFHERLKPEGYARSLLHDWGIQRFPVDPVEICGLLGIGYREDDMGTSGGYDGALVREAGMAGILINSNIPYLERKRFTAAHELGHYTIKGHNLAQYWCSGRDIVGHRSRSAIESEANAFASELLLPERYVTAALKRSGPSFDLARDLGKKFGVSLTATSLKLVKHAPDACALVMSDNGAVKWTVLSERFTKVFEVRHGALSPDTYAVDYFAGKTLPPEARKVTTKAWGRTLPGCDIDFLFEHSIAFPDLNLVLTMLLIPEPDPDEETPWVDDD